jgi:alkyl sulfatase BDS1-like metallo-beta-lactamase superfamily hydrolase
LRPKGKMPSRFTVELRNGAKKTLPSFEDQRDFDENKRGLIAVPPFNKIMADAGNVAWDMESYSFLLQGKDFEPAFPG